MERRKGENLGDETRFLLGKRLLKLSIAIIHFILAELIIFSVSVSM